jgi:hypothetical protein
MKRRSFFKALAAIAASPLILSEARGEPAAIKSTVIGNLDRTKEPILSAWEIEYEHRTIKDSMGFDAATVILNPTVKQHLIYPADETPVLDMGFHNDAKPPLPKGYDFEFDVWMRMPDIAQRGYDDDGDPIVCVTRTWKVYSDIKGHSTPTRIMDRLWGNVVIPRQ